MNTETFFQQFKRHLLVAEPKQSEIIRELRQHGEQQLGDPKQLAKRYNRTHLGIFCTPLRLTLIPVLGWAVFVGLLIWGLKFEQFRWEIRTAERFYHPNGFPLRSTILDIPNYVFLLTIIMLFLLATRTLARYQRLLYPIMAMAFSFFLAGTMVMIGIGSGMSFGAIVTGGFTNFLTQNVSDLINPFLVVFSALLAVSVLLRPLEQFRARKILNHD